MNLEDYEWYGDKLVYNPINNCMEKDVEGMTEEEFKEYMKRIERREKNGKTV